MFAVPPTPSARARRSSGTRLAARSVAAIDSASLREQSSDALQVLAPTRQPGGVLLEGLFETHALRDGLSLQRVDVVHPQALHTRLESIESGVRVVLKLEGDADVRFGTARLALDAGRGEDARPCGAVVSLLEPAPFERRCRAGVRERLVVATLSPSWLLASGIDAARFGPHLSIRPWQPSARAVGLAGQLLLPAVQGDAAGERMMRESRVLELVAEALGGTSGEVAPVVPGLHPDEYLRVERLRGRLDEGAESDLATLARQLGCNLNTLQQHFRRAFGCTISDYVRERRLQRAAHALRTEGVSVGRAAELAGYSSQANFSTAFRRRFGSSPKHCRQRL